MDNRLSMQWHQQQQKLQQLHNTTASFRSNHAAEEHWMITTSSICDIQTESCRGLATSPYTSSLLGPDCT